MYKLMESKTMIDTLIIGGGSIKTIASIGALDVLQKKGILDNINKFAGSSAGAVLVTLLVLGYTPNEINELIFSKIGNYTNDSFYKIPINMIYNYGIYTGNNMIKFLETFFEKKNFKKDITFKELYERTLKVLVITGTSLSTRDTLFFNYQTTPDMSVIKALRITSSIPLYFTSIKHLHKEKEHLMCDGGLLCNFPLYYFDHKKQKNETTKQLKLSNKSNTSEYILYDSFNELNKKQIETNQKFKGTNNVRTIIGILLLEQDENRDTENFYTGFNIITNLKEYITSFIETILKKIEQDNFLNPLTGTKKNFFNNTITIKTPPEINTFKFNLTESENKMLYDLGVKGANDFFDTDT
jgi:predicted acylesterase/phospholipase RssA